MSQPSNTTSPIRDEIRASGLRATLRLLREAKSPMTHAEVAFNARDVSREATAETGVASSGIRRNGYRCIDLGHLPSLRDSGGMNGRQPRTRVRGYQMSSLRDWETKLRRDRLLFTQWRSDDEWLPTPWIHERARKWRSHVR